MPRFVGRAAERFRARDIVSGKILFSQDMPLKGTLALKVLRSEKPHADIISIDYCRAMKIPGVLGVLTAKDIPGENRHGVIVKDQPLLACEKVRFIGEPVALIVAEDEKIAQKALGEIGVTYRDLPAIFDPEEALSQKAPWIHSNGNILARRFVKKGNVEEGFAKSHIVVTGTYYTPHLEHSYLEPDCGGGYLDEDGRLVIFASTQNPHYDHRSVAEILGLEEDRVRIIQAATGGGFGSKLDLTVQGFIALALYHFGKPVRLSFSREEVFAATSKRHPSKITLKMGAGRNGKIMALEANLTFDTGAYASYGVPIAMRAAIHVTGPYEIDNVDVESTSVYTNNPIAGAMRGVAIVQTTFASESQMDILASALGMDPLELRKMNALRPGSTTCTGQKLNESVGMLEAFKAIEPYYTDAKETWKTEEEDKNRRRGVGLGAMWYGIGNMSAKNPSKAEIKLNREGNITLFSGAADIGQGSNTILCQICHEVLGVDPGFIKLISGDTAYTPDAGSTSASRQTYISGNAVKNAAEKMADALLSFGSEILELPRQRVYLDNGFVVDSRDAEHRVAIPYISEKMYTDGVPLSWQGYFDPVTTPLDPKTGQGIPFATYAFACHLALVDVNTQTGEVKVHKIFAAHDVGKAINPQSVEGQIHGGVGMGLGFALTEEFLPGKTLSMSEYYIPTSMDVPEIQSFIIEAPEPTGPFGAKGMGEPALAPVAPAVINAIADAIGERIYQVPATIERVRSACDQAMIRS